jgi:hypothetical protein
MVASLAGAAVLSIENAGMMVRYDEASQSFTVSNKASSLVFAQDGKLSGTAQSAVVESVQDVVFGGGEKIVVTHADGGTTALELYKGLPFVLIRKTLKNSGTTEIDVPKVVPASFAIDLSKPVGEITTMGTAGLLPADQNPGSYVFLTCADPATRKGVVTGFISQKRASGVVFSSVSSRGDFDLASCYPRNRGDEVRSVGRLEEIPVRNPLGDCQGSL